MWRTEPRRWLLAGLLVAPFVLTAGSAAGQDSVTLASQLAEAMTGGQLDAIAAKDSEGADRFVAALVFPGQLLVVSARYEVPMYVEQKIADRQYREVYIDLNAASIADTKVLITDSGADGLSASGDAVDVYDTGTQVLRFDGDWGGQQMSEDAYMKTFADAEQQYARMLRVLVTEAR